MEYALLGWPDAGPTLRLDYRAFAYAGKFVVPDTGKAVVRVETGESRPPTPRGNHPDGVDPDAFADDIVAAIAFSPDRTDSETLWLRYVTVHDGRRGEGIGPRLAAFVAGCAERRGYRRLRIAVNNPFAYEALYKAGFAYADRETGLAELVLERPGERDRATYQRGLDVYRERDYGDDAPERAFLDGRADAGPPPRISPPTESETAGE